MAKTVEDLVAAARSRITEIDCARARSLIEEGATVVDVREPAEWEKGTIDGALTIPRGLLEWKVAGEPALADRAAPVVVYCQAGGRAALANLRAATRLVRRGITSALV
ncbi:MAG: rhodanese-like domain-containing protein, partial [Gammaproteobacteria bacterium]